MGSTRCGISAEQLKREIGASRKTAWRTFRMIRVMMDEEVMDLLGEIEVDESYFGGKESNKHLSKRKGRHLRLGKQAVFGMVGRGGRVVADVIPIASLGYILPTIKEKVIPRSVTFSDEASVYTAVRGIGYQHHRVNHSQKVYVAGNASTNTIGSFWSLAKRRISGVHYCMSDKYL